MANIRIISQYFINRCSPIVIVAASKKFVEMTAGSEMLSMGLQQRETERLDALDQLDVLNMPRDTGFDRIVRLIKEIFTVDIGLVTLIDAHRQWYLSCSGLPYRDVPRDDTFCRNILNSEAALVVPDTSQDDQFSNHPAVSGDDRIRFYAGVPLRTKQGHVIGTVCAIDRSPRSFSDKDLGILHELSALAMDRIELLQFAATDGLTETLTRRAFKQEADKAISMAVHYKHDLSCLVLDIDHFKTINDRFGHAAGDDVLKNIAATCKNMLKAGDLFGRLGGEEFAFVFPYVNSEAALLAAENIRKAIASSTIDGHYGTLTVTASLGASTLTASSLDIEALLIQADTAMYKAKNAGRNRCVLWASEPAANAASCAEEDGDRNRTSFSERVPSGHAPDRHIIKTA